MLVCMGGLVEVDADAIWFCVRYETLSLTS